MMNEMMGSGMMWGMGLWWILVVILLILSIAALAKYLFSRR
jgi:predicted RND superfamily exporter protein